MSSPSSQPGEVPLLASETTATPMRISSAIGRNSAPLGKLIIVRHGESAWNATHQFAGWCDIPLTDAGVEQAKDCAAALRNAGDPALAAPDVGFSSELVRACRTLDLVLQGLGLDEGKIPVFRTWKLNERHMGALTGVCKKDTEQLKMLLPRDKTERYPPMPSDHTLFEEMQAQAMVWMAREQPAPDDEVREANPPPNGEGFVDVNRRVIGVFEERVVPMLQNGKTVLLVCHWGVMLSLCGYLECGTGGSFDLKLADKDGLMGVERILKHVDIPNARPVVYEFVDDSKGKLAVDISKKRIIQHQVQDGAVSLDRALAADG